MILSKKEKLNRENGSRRWRNRNRGGERKGESAVSKGEIFGETKKIGQNNQSLSQGKFPPNHNLIHRTAMGTRVGSVVKNMGGGNYKQLIKSLITEGTTADQRKDVLGTCVENEGVERC